MGKADYSHYCPKHESDSKPKRRGNACPAFSYLQRNVITHAAQQVLEFLQ